MAEDREDGGTSMLGGVRVLDLTTVLMGPFASHILADMGADVIKIESPQGDSFRRWAPARHDGMYGSVLNLHRNKRSLLLDLKDPPCRQALDHLIAGAQVLVHNLRADAARRLRLDWPSVRGINPKIVLCAARGFGHEGPYGHKAAYDDLIQAGSGIAALYGLARGEPRYVPTALVDKISGQAMAYSILGALLHVARGGAGQEVEVPMYETAVEWTLIEHFGPGAFEPALGPVGFPRQMSSARKPYRTADGWACILPYSARNWTDFFDFIGSPELARDPRFSTQAGRLAHVDELYAIVEAHAVRHTTASWEAFCDAVSIPCMPVRCLQDVREDRHLQAVGLFELERHPSEGAYHSVRSPVRFSGTPYRLRRHAPTVGQHTEEVLREAGVPPAILNAVLQAARRTPQSSPPQKETDHA